MVDYYRKIERSVTISANKRSTVDLQVDVWSADANITKFILKLDTADSTAIDLTDATVTTALVYDGVILQDNGQVEEVATQRISYVLNERLRGYEGIVNGGFYVTLKTGQKIDIQNVSFNMCKSLIDTDLEPAKESYYQTFDDIVADVQSKGEKSKTDINAVVSDVQSVGDTAKEDIKTTLPSIQTQVSELKSDLDDYIIKEKILTRGVESGWYSISGNTITENEHPTWTRTHLAAPFSFNSLRFEIKDKIKCVFTIKNSGIIDFYDIVGKYDLDISDCSDVYINFFGNTLVSDYYLYYSYKPYESGYIKFKVQVNQRVVTPNDTANKLIDTESISGVTCHLKLPTSYRPYGKPTKLLMVCHGAGRGVTIPHPDDNKTWEDNENYNALIDTFVNAGYAIFDCNGYKDDFWGCNFWGTHRGVEAWRKAYDYIVKNYNVEDNVSIYGFSMGGLTALNLVMNGFPNVKVVALGSPVLDPQKAFENGQAVIMGGAYGMGSTWEPIKARGCSPIERIVTIGNTEMLLQNLPPIKIWYGSTEQDEIVNKNYASRFVNAIINGGGYATYREVEGENHRICLGAVQYINNEYLYWINRFNN